MSILYSDQEGQRLINCYSVAGLSLALLLSSLPSTTRVLALDQASCNVPNHYFSPSKRSRFQSEEILASMHSMTRLASTVDHTQGIELRSIYGNVEGSARSIISSKALFDKLLFKLVTDTQVLTIS